MGKRDPRLPKVNGSGERYIDELEDYTSLKKKALVAIDSNMSDLLYCVDSPDVDKKIYRYTQDTRGEVLN